MWSSGVSDVESRSNHLRATLRALRDNGLLGLNGFMACFCALFAAVLAAMIGGVLLLSSLAAVVGPGHWSTSWFDFKVAASSGSVTVRTCIENAGKQTCTNETRPLRPDEIKPDPIGATLGAISTLFGLVSLSILTFGLANASGCFINLARGRFFDRRTVRSLRNFAMGGLMFVLVFPNRDALGTAAVQVVDRVMNQLNPSVVVHHGVGHDFFAIAPFGTISDALIIVYALTLTTMAAVMAKAATVAEDHAQIV